MRFADTLKRSGRNLRHAKIRTLLTASALAVGGFTLTLTLAAATGAREYSNRLVQANFDPNSVIVANDKSFFSNQSSTDPKLYSDDLATSYGALLKQLNAQDIAKIKSLPHVDRITENFNLNAQYITREGTPKYTGGLSVYDPAQKPQMKAGTAPEVLSSGSVLMPDKYLQRLHFTLPQDALGKTIVVQVRQYTGETLARDFVVAGVTTKSSLDIGFNTIGLFLNEQDARTLNTFVNGGTILADKVPTVVVRGTNIAAEQLKQELTHAGYEARTAKDLQQLLNQIINVLQGIIVVFGLITLVASFFGVVNTQYISVLERTREIGLMKALGMSRRGVSRLFMIEATWIGFIGALLGSLIALGAGHALNPTISKKLNFGHEHLLIFKPLQIVALVVFLMLVTTVAGLLPARKAAKLDPIEALRTE